MGHRRRRKCGSVCETCHTELSTQQPEKLKIGREDHSMHNLGAECSRDPVEDVVERCALAECEMRDVDGAERVGEGAQTVPVLGRADGPCARARQRADAQTSKRCNERCRVRTRCHSLQWPCQTCTEPIR